jgi:hypothetical protein
VTHVDPYFLHDDKQYHDTKALTKTKNKTMLMEKIKLSYDMRYNPNPKIKRPYDSKQDKSKDVLTPTHPMC